MKILCGIQPTGRIHIGNYLGSIKKAIEMQQDYHVVFLIADLHALTTQNQVNTSIIKDELTRLGAKFIIHQTAQDTLLFWQMLCKTGVGDLERMTQWKDRGGSAGMLTYPVLMCADIHADNYDAVLVGEDQKQHLELAERIGKKMGYKKRKSIFTETPRIMSIADPAKKMSKSLGDKHCVYLFDDLKVNEKKIMKAPTTPEGIKNLQNIAKGLGVDFDVNDCKKSKQLIIKSFNLLNG